jgi:ribosomal protein L11 methylase PrmA
VALAFDIDPGAVEKNYLDCRQRKDTGMLPLVLDLTNPSPALGWANAERNSLAQRGPADMALALALVHHLAISNNVPLPDLAAFFSQITHWLVIEFVPKEDSQVQRLLATRKDIFDHYDRQGFEQAFSQYFTIRDVKEVEGSKRTLYLMEKNAA